MPYMINSRSVNNGVSLSVTKSHRHRIGRSCIRLCVIQNLKRFLATSGKNNWQKVRAKFLRIIPRTLDHTIGLPHVCGKYIYFRAAIVLRYCRLNCVTHGTCGPSLSFLLSFIVAGQHIASMSYTGCAKIPAGLLWTYLLWSKNEI